MKEQKIEPHIPLPSVMLMIHQWQKMPNLFHDVCWTNKPEKTKLVFTSYCLN